VLHVVNEIVLNGLESICQVRLNSEIFSANKQEASANSEVHEYQS